MPRPFDLFASMKSSNVRGLVELHKKYLCCGYTYSFDLHQMQSGEEECTLQQLIKPNCCSPLGVQLKYFGAGVVTKTVVSIGPKGKAVSEEDGLPIVAVDLSTPDTFRVHRIAGLFRHACTLHTQLMPTHVHALYNCGLCSLVQLICLLLVLLVVGFWR